MSGLQHDMEEGARCQRRGVLFSSIRAIWRGHSAESCPECLAVLLHWRDVAESELRRKLMSTKQAAEACIAGSASRKKKKVDKKIVMGRFHRRLRQHFFGVSELKLSVIRNRSFHIV